ncbi:hypothetical protein HMPREF0201_02366 [Cedecea davisae DSM 4568]|uniref:Uncharacterized protein n=1 Tax=Cedecea davisae DSM 4568 TaxID=566551 RepID=S3IUG6_9ENTR|nr:hypothetical protein HMPREF0201_02366 [Cedecea davisae DSM 4568]
MNAGPGSLFYPGASSGGDKRMIGDNKYRKAITNSGTGEEGRGK